MDYIQGIKLLKKNKVPFLSVHRELKSKSILSSLLLFKNNEAYLFDDFEDEKNQLGFKVEIPFSKEKLKFIRAIQINGSTYYFNLKYNIEKNNKIDWYLGTRIKDIKTPLLKNIDFCLVDMIYFEGNWTGFNVQINPNIDAFIFDNLEIKKLFITKNKEIINYA